MEDKFNNLYLVKHILIPAEQIVGYYKVLKFQIITEDLFNNYILYIYML